MKKIFLIALVLCSLQSCAQEVNTVTSLTYKASSRGLFHNITLSSKTISIQKERSVNKRDTVALPKESWEELKKLLAKLPEDMEKTGGPESDKLWVDAAIPGELILTKTKGKDSIVIHLDHSNPPLQLKPLIDRILSLAESVE